MKFLFNSIESSWSIFGHKIPQEVKIFSSGNIKCVRVKVHEFYLLLVILLENMRKKNRKFKKKRYWTLLSLRLLEVIHLRLQYIWRNKTITDFNTDAVSWNFLITYVSYVLFRLDFPPIWVDIDLVRYKNRLWMACV